MQHVTQSLAEQQAGRVRQGEAHPFALPGLALAGLGFSHRHKLH
jgi:hypothetical protein